MTWSTTRRPSHEDYQASREPPGLNDSEYVFGNKNNFQNVKHEKTFKPMNLAKITILLPTWIFLKCSGIWDFPSKKLPNLGEIGRVMSRFNLTQLTIFMCNY